MYLKRSATEIAKPLQNYSFNYESHLQESLFEQPGIVVDLLQTELESTDVVINIREFAVSMGSIDNLFITRSADIVIVETKLYKNPEATRKVVAQLVDYIKTVALDGPESFYELLLNAKGQIYIEKDILENDSFVSSLLRNVEKGNIRGVVLGDDIHSNLLGLVSSIQSAPHLAFGIYLIRLESYLIDEMVILNPYLVEKTSEIERSILSIEIDISTGKTTVNSQSPDKGSGSNKPKLSWNEFLDTVSARHRNRVEEINEKWFAHVDNAYRNMGISGFSLGVKVGNNYKILEVHPDYMQILTDKARRASSIPSDVYRVYSDTISQNTLLYDDYLSSGKATIKYDVLEDSELEVIMEASIALANEFLKDVDTSK